MAVLIKPYMPSPAVVREAGKLAIRQGQLDHILKLTIKSLCKIGIHSDEYKKRTHNRQSSVLRKDIKALARDKLAVHRDALDDLIAQIDRIGELTDYRNLVVHSVWSRLTTGGAVKLRDSKTDELHRMPTVKELRAAADEMYELCIELNTSRLKGKLKQALS